MTISDDLLKLAHRRAAEPNRPAKIVIDEALRIGLTAGQSGRKPYRFRPPVMKGRLGPDADFNERHKLVDLRKVRRPVPPPDTILPV